jgi:hypothetical protein
LGRGALAYTLPKSQQNFYVRLTAGTSVDADRFSAIGSVDFCRWIGISALAARLLFSGNQRAPVRAAQRELSVAARPEKRWNLYVNASSAFVDYLPGESQPGNWLNGVGGGILYHRTSDRLKIMAHYGYGIDAIRSHGRGANSNVASVDAVGFGGARSRTFNSRNRSIGAAGNGFSAVKIALR